MSLLIEGFYPSVFLHNSILTVCAGTSTVHLRCIACRHEDQPLLIRASYKRYAQYNGLLG